MMCSYYDLLKNTLLFVGFTLTPLIYVWFIYYLSHKENMTQEQWEAMVAHANSLDTTKYMTQEEIQRREEWKAQQREKDLG